MTTASKAMEQLSAATIAEQTARRDAARADSAADDFAEYSDSVDCYATPEWSELSGQASKTAKLAKQAMATLVAEQRRAVAVCRQELKTATHDAANAVANCDRHDVALQHVKALHRTLAPDDNPEPSATIAEAVASRRHFFTEQALSLESVVIDTTRHLLTATAQQAATRALLAKLDAGYVYGR